MVLDIEGNHGLDGVTAKIDVGGQEQKSKTSKLATTSLVLGFLSIITFGILSPVGVVFGLVSLAQINCSGGQLKGNRRATFGILLSSLPIAVIYLLQLVAVFYIPRQH